ncbi:hypothetical protein ACWCSD_31940 [Nonomuraea sp. NPDC001684]
MTSPTTPRPTQGAGPRDETARLHARIEALQADIDLQIRHLRVENEKLRGMVAVQQRFVPALPELDGATPITWRRWEPALLMSHIDPSCEQCAHPGPRQMAIGLAAPHPGHRPLIRYQASRCPACQEMTVYRRDTGPNLRTTLTEIAYHPPQEPR